MSLRARLRELERKFGVVTPSLPPPDVIVTFTEPVFDADGQHVFGGRRCDSVRASVALGSETTFYDRNPDETLGGFENRVLSIHSRGHLRLPRLVIFRPRDEKDVPAPPTAPDDGA